MFATPKAIVADSQGNLFVLDSGNYRIRKIAPDSTVSTFAGGGNQTHGVGTNVYFGQTIFGMTIDRNNTIWMVGVNPGAYYYYDELYKITADGS